MLFGLQFHCSVKVHLTPIFSPKIMKLEKIYFDLDKSLIFYGSQKVRQKSFSAVQIYDFSLTN